MAEHKIKTHGIEGGERERMKVILELSAAMPSEIVRGLKERKRAPSNCYV